MRWTLAQQRKYRAQVKALGLSDEERRDLLYRLTGHYSTADLTAEEMARVLEEQDRMLGQIQGVVERHSQDDLIHALERRLGWDSNPRRLAGFIRRQTHGRKDNLADLDRKEKVALIEALKGVKAHLRPDRSRLSDPVSPAGLSSGD